MIFLGGMIQPTAINAHAPPINSPSRNELIMLILNDGHSTLFRNYLNWTHAFTILDRIDDTSIKQFDKLLFHNHLHIKI